MRLAPGDARSGFLLFAVPDYDRPAALQVVFGNDLTGDIGEWTLRKVVPGRPRGEDANGSASTAAAALGQLGLWTEKLASSDVEARRVGAIGLAQLNDPHAREALEQALGDPDLSVRTWAARGLAALRDPRSVGPLAAALADPVDAQRAEIVAALGEVEGLEAAAVISSAKDDASPSVRRAAERATRWPGEAPAG